MIENLSNLRTKIYYSSSVTAHLVEVVMLTYACRKLVSKPLSQICAQKEQNITKLSELLINQQNEFNKNLELA